MSLITGRKDATATMDHSKLTEDHYRLGNEIERSRKDVDSLLKLLFCLLYATPTNFV